jgi:hypothetical protein
MYKYLIVILQNNELKIKVHVILNVSFFTAVLSEKVFNIFNAHQLNL